MSTYRDAHLELLDELNGRLDRARAGGGAKSMERHVSRGKLPVRERVARLCDPGSPFLELSALAAEELYDGDAPGAGMVTGVAIVNELTEFVQFDLELIGTHGKIILGMGENRLWGIKKATTRDTSVDPNIEWQNLDARPFPAVAQRTPMEEAADDVVRCLETGGTPLSTGDDGRAAIEIIMAIYESERHGHTQVTLPLPGGPSTLHVMRQEGFYR